MTRECVTTESPFSAWLRSLGGELDSSRTSVTDIDYVIDHYMEGWFMTLELKTGCHALTAAQRDTQSIIAQMLQFASDKGALCRTARGERAPMYYGHHIIVLSGTDPVTSTIWLDGNTITLRDLEAFLNTSCF